MDVRPTAIPGCYALQLVFHQVVRDRYVQVALGGDFARHGMATRFAATYPLRGRRRMLWGLHAVPPPMEQDALVYCVRGEVFHAVVDLRAGSPAFGRHETTVLSAARANMRYVPAGVAHGFCVVSDEAEVVYQVTSERAPYRDAGVLWSSAGIPWPEREPLVAESDLRLPELARFESLFVYAPGVDE
jgi:dTDP-4-dehydrorhamnose 3,5-epimerase